MSTDVVRNLCKKMAPPLVTLLSAEPEIQYVALRNINLIVQKRPTILAHEIKVTFFSSSYSSIMPVSFSNSMVCVYRFSFASTMTLYMLRWKNWRL